MIQEAERITDAWRRSPLARIQPGEVILVTDFDGTLAEIVQDPAAARARPEALEALEQLVPLLADVIVLSSRPPAQLDRKSTRLNSSHSQISYAVFCLKKKNNNA